MTNDKLTLPANFMERHTKEINENVQLMEKRRKCGKANHFAALCKSKQERGKVVNNVTETESEQYEDIWSITTESVNKVSKSLDRQPCQLFAGMLLKKNLVKFQLDCGATCNIIPINFVNPDVKIEKPGTCYVQQKYTETSRQMPFKTEKST